MYLCRDVCMSAQQSIYSTALQQFVFQMTKSFIYSSLPILFPHPDYPNAIYYPFKITTEFLGSKGRCPSAVILSSNVGLRHCVGLSNYQVTTCKQTYTEMCKLGKELSKPLENILGRNKALDCFVEALGGLTHPELRFKDGFPPHTFTFFLYYSLAFGTFLTIMH